MEQRPINAQTASTSRKQWLTENKKWWFALLVPLFLGGGILTPWIAKWADRDETAAERVESCMTQHGLKRATDFRQEKFSRAHYESTGEYSRRVFASCDWPPGAGAERDGYSEVSVIAANGPGRDEASSANTLDRIRATCKKVEVAYTTGAQGVTERLPPFQVELGSVLSAYDGRPWKGDSPFPYPERDEIVLLRDSKISLDTVRCV